LTQLLQQAGVRFHAPLLAKVAAWAEAAPSGQEHGTVHQRIMTGLDDDRRAKTEAITALERDLAALLATTPDVLLLSIPGVNVVSAAEFAGARGPIGHSAGARAITGRAGLFPARYQSDQVDRRDGPLVRCGNRNLRQAILTIADNLIRCHQHFRGLADHWRQAGAVGQLPRDQDQAEAAPLIEAWNKASGLRGRGPQLLDDLLPVVLARLGVDPGQLSSSGEKVPREPDRAWGRTTSHIPKAQSRGKAWRSVGSPTPDKAVWGHSPDIPVRREVII
jgi:hypothetical protein